MNNNGHPRIYEHHQELMDLIYNEYFPKIYPILINNVVSFSYKGYACAFCLVDENIKNYNSIIDNYLTDIDNEN
jgi:hypothetical protein